MNFTPLVKPHFVRRARRTLSWASDGDRLQSEMLRRLLARAASTEVGNRYGFTDILRENDPAKAFAQRVPCIDYETMRGDVWRMIKGGRDILWPGRCRWYAQSSGTSGGKSKYIPITDDSLRLNHYRGAEDSVSHYIAANPATRIFAGKGMILGGSFANEIPDLPKGVHVGDLSATLIKRITPLADLVRVPEKRIALMPDWEMKLPALAQAALNNNVTNISGVPSWFLTVIKHILSLKGAGSLSEVWPNLEVFFRRRNSFRAIPRGIPAPDRRLRHALHGNLQRFGRILRHPERPCRPCDAPDNRLRHILRIHRCLASGLTACGHSGRGKGKVYELVITAPNGLWRYRLGDTVKIESTAPLKITIAGRTKCFINAFGEELMECNADEALAKACRETGASIKNYTAGPVFTCDGHRGRHEWIVEWENRPADSGMFAARLDETLQELSTPTIRPSGATPYSLTR